MPLTFIAINIILVPIIRLYFIRNFRSIRDIGYPKSI